MPPPLQRRRWSIRTQGPQGSPRLPRCRNTKNWRRLGKVMGPRDVPARSPAILAALAPLPSAVPADSDLSTGRSPGPSPGPELNTPCSHKSSRLHFPQRPSPSLGAPCRPDLRSSALPACPTPSLSSAADPRPQQTCQPSFLPRLLLTISRPSQSIAFIIDLLPWQPQPLPAAHSFEPQQAPLCHVPTSQSSATPGFHPEPLSSLQASETTHSRDASPSRDGLPGVEKGAPSFPHTPLTSLP